METPPVIPLSAEPSFAQKWFSGGRYSKSRLFGEIGAATVVGFGLRMAPALLLPTLPPNYYHTVFLPVITRAAQAGVVPHREILVFLDLAVPFAFGFIGRGPVWLIGSALGLAYPIGTIVDLLAGGGGHNLWPFELVIWVPLSFLFIVPTGLGRVARRWWTFRGSNRNRAN
jgi:hypothetical protein